MTLPLDQDTETHGAVVHPSTSFSTVIIDKPMQEPQETVIPPPPVTVISITPKQDEVRGNATITPATASTSERCQLEDYTPFARSHLWKLMMSFYDRQGVESWAQGIVPHFITSNTFIAKKYSQVFRAYLRDCMRTASLNPNEPLFIVELGTGSGKFSFYFLTALAEAEAVLDFPLHRIKYIMTDFTEQNFTFWTSHPALASFVTRGMVDFAIFDATKDKELVLYHSKQVIQPHQLVNPIAIIANYLFDTLYHDLFQVDQGVLKQGLISVGSKRSSEVDPLDPDIIKRLWNLYQYHPITTSFYGEEQVHLNAILQWYQEYYEPSSSGATILVPIGALSAIERLSQLSQYARVVILSGDKGNNHPDHFRGLSDPHIAVHGSFSVMVNYHAIGVYCASRGGFALHSPQEEASLKVSVFVLPGSNDKTPMTLLYRNGLESVCTTRRTSFPHLTRAFEEEIVAFGPNDFFVLQKAMKEDSKTPSLKAVLSLLKLSGWDPDTFYKFRDVLLDHSPSSAPKLKRDVLGGMPLVWKNYYALDREKDIAFEIGRLYYGLHDYDAALAFYTLSMKEMGLHHVTSHNMGLCYYSKCQLTMAATCFEQAFGLNSSYTKAATWLQRVQKEMGETPLLLTNGEKPPSEDLIVQQIELVLSDHEEERARTSLSRLSMEETTSPTSPTPR